MSKHVPREIVLKLADKGLFENKQYNLQWHTSYQDVIDWFREKHDINIYLTKSSQPKKYIYTIESTNENLHDLISYEYYLALDKAFEVASKLI